MKPAVCSAPKLPPKQWGNCPTCLNGSYAPVHVHVHVYSQLLGKKLIFLGVCCIVCWVDDDPQTKQEEELTLRALWGQAINELSRHHIWWEFQTGSAPAAQCLLSGLSADQAAPSTKLVRQTKSTKLVRQTKIRASHVCCYGQNCDHTAFLPWDYF